jgi:hypothetical protein
MACSRRSGSGSRRLACCGRAYGTTLRGYLTAPRVLFRLSAHSASFSNDAPPSASILAGLQLTAADFTAQVEHPDAQREFARTETRRMSRRMKLSTGTGDS